MQVIHCVYVCVPCLTSMETACGCIERARRCACAEPRTALAVRRQAARQPGGAVIPDDRQHWNVHYVSGKQA